MTVEPSTLREQLEGLAERIRGKRSEVQIVSQITLEIPTRDTATTFAAVREVVLKWMSRRAGKPLPKVAFEGRSFELDEVGRQPVEAVALQDPVYWAGRHEDADKNVAQRQWVTEVGLGIGGENQVLFGCRLYCVALGENPPYMPSLPTFAREIAKEFGGRVDGRRILDRSWTVDSAEDVARLVDFLKSPSRRRPVIIIALGEDGEAPGPCQRV